ncbi:MAG: type IV pilus twitching motility protein PilT [Candidatus Omnitrophica bacterium]|nr:type IV pilus twitching motility protein PilT [Candidatus Omnitrophota bacterium]
MTSSIDELLKLAVARRASDLHLTVGLPPLFRIDGQLTPLEDAPLTGESARALAYAMLDDQRIVQFEQSRELDTSYSVKGLSRFRVNLYRQRGSVAAVIRVIPFQVPTFEELGLPSILKEFAERLSGLFIVSGPTGCGKSTTLAAMVRHINERRNCHILTVEDPIEYLHQHKKATINQRELGTDTDSFKEALRHAVRQDPNILLIGEMRDLETMSAALTLAETGHLVLATLHTSDTMHAITRIVDVFPPFQQTQIRIQLSLVLIGIVVQQLIPRAAGKGRVAVCEVMNVTPAIGSMIRENQLHQLRSSLQTGRQHGMCTMNQSLAELLLEKSITWEEALKRSLDPEDLRRLLPKTSGLP